MKIAIAQTKPFNGDIDKNILSHIEIINIAIKEKTDFIFFPELSLLGYEIELASKLALDLNNKKLKIFQKISNTNKITIGVGIPVMKNNLLHIGLLFFQANKKPKLYCKQFLYGNEEKFFVPGKKDLILNFNNDTFIAPAICFDLSNNNHSKNVFEKGATIYIASVLNSFNGISNDLKKLSEIAKKFKTLVFMSNYVGVSGNYLCAGKSSIWNKNGEILGQLDTKNEGLLICNTKDLSIIKIQISQTKHM